MADWARGKHRRLQKVCWGFMCVEGRCLYGEVRQADMLQQDWGCILTHCRLRQGAGILLREPSSLLIERRRRPAQAADNQHPI